MASRVKVLCVNAITACTAHVLLKSSEGWIGQMISVCLPRANIIIVSEMVNNTVLDYELVVVQFGTIGKWCGLSVGNMSQDIIPMLKLLKLQQNKLKNYSVGLDWKKSFTSPWNMLLNVLANDFSRKVFVLRISQLRIGESNVYYLFYGVPGWMCGCVF